MRVNYNLAAIGLLGGLALQTTSALAVTNLVLACYPGAPETFIREEIIPRFEKQFDAKVTYLTGNSPGTIAKLQAQKADPQIDVACIDDGPMVQAKGMELVQATDLAKLPNASQLNAFSIFPDNVGFGWGLFRLGIAYNPAIAQQQKLPPIESWSDLARPELKGHVVVNSISISYTPIVLTLLAQAYGKSPQDMDAAFAKMKEIAPNVFTYDTTADVTPYFQQEEAWAGVWTDSEVYSYVQRTGFELKFVLPKEGTAAVQTGIAVVKGAKNADMAEKFINYFIGPEAQTLMAEKLGWAPANKEVKVPDAMASIFVSPPENAKIVPIDHTFIAKERPAWVERWNKEIEAQ